MSSPSFMSIPDHVSASDPTSLAPTASTIERWLRGHGFVGPRTRISGRELVWVAAVQEDLRARAIAPTARADERLERAAREAEVTLRFGDPSEPLKARASGVRGAVGRILAIAFLAQLDGSWERLRACSSGSCRSIFFDRSKNRSGRWCSMQTCGNRAKVRAFRERELRQWPAERERQLVALSVPSCGAASCRSRAGGACAPVPHPGKRRRHLFLVQALRPSLFVQVFSSKSFHPSRGREA